MLNISVRLGLPYGPTILFSHHFSVVQTSFFSLSKSTAAITLPLCYLPYSFPSDAAPFPNPDASHTLLASTMNSTGQLEITLRVAKSLGGWVSLILLYSTIWIPQEVISHVRTSSRNEGKGAQASGIRMGRDDCDVRGWFICRTPGGVQPLAYTPRHSLVHAIIATYSCGNASAPS
ncbi:hypothetical protein BD779DRAFT_1522979 [Infundibulicybe gibba]|nr:hypothetical protein BD779DRAFT_1522979 [Infundibulicybe gibba]